MENASKALLIAGAILLVIALIAIGMMILGQGNQVVDEAAGSMDALAIQAFNSQFTAYAGRTLTAMDIANLEGLCQANNVSFGKASGASVANKVSFAYGTASASGQVAGKIYKVTLVD